MKITSISWLAAGFVAVGASGAIAGPNCAQVKKYLGTGRSVQDVAETMIVSEDEVKKCQAEAGKGDASKAGGGAPAGAAAGAAASGSAEKK
jgi:hypothetical protein